MTPSGFKVRMEKHPGAPSWRLIGTVGTGTFCHKPMYRQWRAVKAKSARALRDYMLYGPIFVADPDRDLDTVDEIFAKDYGHRWRNGHGQSASRPLLSPERSLGSVIKLLTPAADYSDDYNGGWRIPELRLPDRVHHQAVLPARMGRRLAVSHFGVDIVNGFPGHELKYNGRKAGRHVPAHRPHRSDDTAPAAWRTYKVRQDFAAATKIQTEDDITASTVCPGQTTVEPEPRPRPRRSDRPRQFQVRREHRVPAVPTARRRSAPRAGQADRGRHEPARQLHQQLRAADGRRRRRRWSSG